MAFTLNARRFACPSLLSLLVPLLALPASAVSARFVRTPDVRGHVVVLSWEGDLFRVPLAGGTAVRMTTHPGNEEAPKISPDGRWLAFRGAYDGPNEVYLMPMDGGAPAVAAAIEHATGLVLDRVPLLPEDLFEASLKGDAR